LVKDPHILILRHAERGEIPSGSFGHDLLLTEEGRKSSLSLGKKLAHIRWAQVFSSPLIRCQETAEHFLKGTGQSLPITLTPHLGDPGPFVFDQEKAGSIFLENTPYIIMQKILSAQHVPGMRTLEDGVKLFVDYLKTFTHFPCLMISHDIIIALLQAYFSKSTPHKFPDFLNGFWLKIDEKSDDKSCKAYNSAKKRVSDENFEGYPRLSLSLQCRIGSLFSDVMP